MSDNQGSIWYERAVYVYMNIIIKTVKCKLCKHPTLTFIAYFVYDVLLFCVFCVVLCDAFVRAIWSWHLLIDLSTLFTTLFSSLQCILKIVMMYVCIIQDNS